MKALAAVCLLGGSLVFSGCTSKEPLDYLPECAAYCCMNVEQTRAESGAHRFLEGVRKTSSQTSAVGDKVTHFYLGIAEIPSPAPAIYGVIIGQPGTSEAVLNELKKAGDTETKIDGKKAVTNSTGNAVYIQLSDTALLLADSTASYETMVKTAKKKNPSAANSPLFQKLKGLCATHALSAVWNPQPLVSQFAPQLNMLAMMNPKAPEAIKQIQMVSLVVDWDKQPRVDLLASLGDDQGRQALAALTNMALQQMKNRAGDSASMLPPLEAKPTSEGVQITLEASQQASDQVLTQFEQGVAKLPDDPEQRKAALWKLGQQIGAGLAPQAGSTSAPKSAPGEAGSATK